MSDLRSHGIIQIADDDVEAPLDLELRDLLSACFKKPGDEIFRSRRYFTEMPSWRWLLRDGDRLVAHVAAHQRTIQGEIRMLGIAEVCVLPSHRGQGLVRGLLAVAHEWGIGAGFEFATLFGRREIYASSGYQTCSGGVMVRDGGSEPVLRPAGDFLIHRLGGLNWPSGDVDLRGPVF